MGDEEIVLGGQASGLFNGQPDAVDAYGNPINTTIPTSDDVEVKEKGEGLTNDKLNKGIAAAGLASDVIQKADLGGDSFGTYANNITKYAGAGAQVGGVYGALAGVAVGVGASMLEENAASKAASQQKAIDANTADTAKKKSIYQNKATSFYGGMQDEAKDVYGVDKLLNANKTLLS